MRQPIHQIIHHSAPRKWAGRSCTVNPKFHYVSLFNAIGLLVVCVATPAWGGSFSMSAKTGHFEARTLTAPADAVSFSATAKFINFAGSAQWPAASYIGIHEGPDRNNSLQVLAIRNKMADDYLVLGYRLIIGGKEAKVESIANVPMNTKLEVQIEFSRGAASLNVNGGPAIEVQTPFKQVAPYVSVSSGEAEFRVER